MDDRSGSTGAANAGANGANSAEKPAAAPDHACRAEELLDEARKAAASGTEDAAERSAQKIAEAQVHATLALAAGPPPRSIRYGFVVLVVALFFGWLLISGYQKLSHSYPAVTVAGSTHNLQALQDVTMSPANGSVTWTQQGDVQELDVTGPAVGTAEVTLPLPASQCPVLAKALGTTCQGGDALAVSHAVQFAWQSPEEVSSSGSSLSGSAGGLTISTSLGATGGGGLTMLTETTSVPTACFAAPSSGAILTVSGGYRYPNGRSRSWAQTCSAAPSRNGVTVSVTLGAPGLGSGQPPLFTFGGINSMTVCASGSDGILQGFAGQLNLAGGTTNLGTPATVQLKAAPLLVSLDVGPDSTLSAQPPCAAAPAPSCTMPAEAGSLTLCTTAATSVMTTATSGQLVPSAWDSYSAVTVPIFGGLVTVLIVAPLGVSVQVFMDVMKRSRRGRRSRRGSQSQDKAKEANHAS